MNLRDQIDTREARVVVVGQGFVGIPEAIAIARAKYSTIGLDRDPDRVARIARADSPVPDVHDGELRQLLNDGAYRVTTDEAVLADADIIILCVPTPLDENLEPDLSAIRAVARSIARQPRQPRLVILESTVPPGTTRRVVLPLLSGGGGTIGRDLFLGFAPERLDPGNTRFTATNIPRLVSGITSECRELTSIFYNQVLETVKEVESTEIAELAKAMENTFRFINISFANEMALLCDRLGCSVWDVIAAAATKPFAFMPHFPGPGVGGSCIPVVPQYLRQVSREVGTTSRLIDAAKEINDGMPNFVVDKLARLLAARGVALASARILVVGVTYKPDVADIRESPAIPILRLLRERARVVSYHDTYCSGISLDGEVMASVTLNDRVLAEADAVVLHTLHSTIDLDLLRRARFIFDTRNALQAGNADNVALL